MRNTQYDEEVVAPNVQMRRAIFVSPKAHRKFKILSVKNGLTFDEQLLALMK